MTFAQHHHGENMRQKFYLDSFRKMTLKNSISHDYFNLCHLNHCRSQIEQIGKKTKILHWLSAIWTIWFALLTCYPLMTRTEDTMFKKFILVHWFSVFNLCVHKTYWTNFFDKNLFCDTN